MCGAQAIILLYPNMCLRLRFISSMHLVIQTHLNKFTFGNLDTFCTFIVIYTFRKMDLASRRVILAIAIGGILTFGILTSIIEPKGPKVK